MAALAGGVGVTSGTTPSLLNLSATEDMLDLQIPLHWSVLKRLGPRVLWRAAVCGLFNRSKLELSRHAPERNDMLC